MIARWQSMASLVVVALLTVSCARSDHDHAHEDEHGHQHDLGHGHDHAHDAEHDSPTGPNGGRLLQQDEITFEVKIDEGLSPRFRVWLTQSGQPIELSEGQLRLNTTRILGQEEQFLFRPDNNSWLATTAVMEPHSFDVQIEANILGRWVTATFESYEGRTVINEAAAREAGIVTAEVTGGSVINALPVMGTLRAAPDAEAMVTARFPGVIKSITVQAGDRITRGDNVAVIDSDLSLAPYTVISPLTGIVAERLQEVGAHVEGDAIVRIIDPRRLIVELSVFGADVSRVKSGQRVDIARRGEQNSVEGRISRITPRLHTTTQSVVAQVQLLDVAPNWPPGAAVTGDIVLDDTPVNVRVPLKALQTFRDWDVVFIQKGDIYEAQPISIGRRDTEFAEVTAGLSGGEIIVIDQSFLIKADIEKSAAVHDH